MKSVLLTLSAFVLFMNACCDEKKVAKSSAPSMKCGAGKCEANMFDGNGALVKKKKNILAQMCKRKMRHCHEIVLNSI